METYPKKKITPHKGGRSARFECRMNPKIKQMLQDQAKAEKATPADLIEKWILENNKKR